MPELHSGFMISQAVARSFVGATPVEGDGHVDTPLSNLAVAAFGQPTEGLIGDQVFPAVPVDKQSDRYYVIDKGNFRRRPDTVLRGPGTRARTINFKVGSDSYFADNYALGAETPIEWLHNADAAIRYRQNNTRLVVGALKREQEIRIANILTSATNLGSGVVLAGATRWSQLATSDPLADINTGHAFMLRQTGLTPNTAIIDWDTLMVLRRHPQLLDLHKYTSGGEINDSQIAAALKVPRILVGKCFVQNEEESAGTETISVTNVWGNNCILAYVDQSGGGLELATLGLRFQWNPPIFPANLGVMVAQDVGAGKKNVEIVEAGHYQDEKLVAADLGYIISTTL
jgi:hypothetical protein